MLPSVEVWNLYTIFGQGALQFHFFLEINRSGLRLNWFYALRQNSARSVLEIGRVRNSACVLEIRLPAEIKELQFLIPQLAQIKLELGKNLDYPAWAVVVSVGQFVAQIHQRELFVLVWNPKLRAYFLVWPGQGRDCVNYDIVSAV